MVSGFDVQGGDPANIINCILWSNTATSSGAQLYVESDVTGSIDYSDIDTGIYNNSGNFDSSNDNGFSSDPDFVESGDDPLNLSSGSPCIDNANGNVDPTTHILGNSRYDDPSTTNNGIGVPPYVDMGAYEYQGS